MDGKPLEFGTVMFQPATGGQAAGGDIDSNGKFTLSTFGGYEGAKVGKHLIRVVCYSTQDPVKFPNGAPGDSLGTLLIPERYTSLGGSGLTAEVPPEGLADFKIELSSKGPGR